MTVSKTTARKLQILPTAYHESEQLDLLSFVSEYALAELAPKAKEKSAVAKTHTNKVVSYHFHGNVDGSKTFSNFCLGKSNKFAVESLARFISSEKSDFGVIFLKASSGLGKSHILHAVANDMQAKKKSFYFSSPLMMSPLIDTLGMLKHYDIILIDDVEEIEGNTELQKIFCQIVDLAQAGKTKLVITGSKFPKDLSGCDERFKGKLSAGLIQQFEEMNNDLAYDIVQARSVALHLSLPETVKRLVSNQVGFNVYGMESLLHKFKSLSDIKGQKITLEVALEEIKDKKVIYRSEEFHRLLGSVAALFHISVDELSSSVRKKEFALARHVAIYVLKEKKQLSVMKIAELFERDHSSVVYAISRIKKMIETDIELHKKILILINESSF